VSPLRSRSFLPCVTLGLAAALATWSPVVFADDTVLSFRVDPAFSRSLLSTTEQKWYDLAWQHSAGCWNTVLTRALYDDTYTYGRSVGDYMAFMLMGLRATGDRQFLDKVRIVSDTMRTTLRDADDACVGGATDGFLDWRWRAINAGSYSCTNTGGYYGSDYHPLDETMTHGNIALIAYAFWVNRDIDPIYADRAAYWLNYLQNHWEKKWIQRNGGSRSTAWLAGSGMYKHEAHVVANLMRAAYYLWKMTGDPFYKSTADELQRRSGLNCVANPNVPSAYSWHHQVDNTTTWQAINYAEYTSSVFCDLHFEGYAPYGDTEIKKFMSTWRDIVFVNSAPSYSQMSPDVYGGGSMIGISASGASAYARWDTSGKLMAYANAVTGGTPGATSIYTIRAITGAMVAVSTRTDTGGTDVTPPASIKDLHTN
jgi:hypothetical protein